MNFVRYTDASPHKSWINANLASFDTRLLDVLLSGRNHTPLSRAGKPPSAAAGNVPPSQPQRGEREDDGIRDIVVKGLVTSDEAYSGTMSLAMTTDESTGSGVKQILALPDT